MVRTHINSKYKTTIYNTRHMRMDLLRRMKRISLKTARSYTIDMILNSALAIGLSSIEQQNRELLK